MSIEIIDMCIQFSPQFNSYFHHQLKGFYSTRPATYFINVEITNDIVVKGDMQRLSQVESLYVDNDNIHIVGYVQDKISYVLSKYNHHYLIKINVDSTHQAEIEYVLSSRVFANIASNHHYLILHASAIRYQTYGILFSGPSGIGKTTLAKRFLEHDPHTTFINDDKPLIKQENQMFSVHGTPWAGSDGLSSNISNHLDIIFFIEQGKTASINTLSNKEKVRYLIEHTHRMFSKQHLDHYIDQLNVMIEKVPIYLIITSNTDQDYHVVNNFIKEIKNQFIHV